MIRNLNFLFVTFFGIGTIRYAPGTITSLITTVFLFNLFYVLNLSETNILVVLVVIFFSSFPAVENYIKDKSNKDPKEIVIDEVIGQSIPIYLYEISHGTTKNPQEAILFYIYIFILFRFFDIKKPFPVSYFDKKHKNYFGIIMDDIMAGLYSMILIYLISLKF